VSRGLGQTELLEVAPSRRLIVREGHTAWWGVDPSTLRVSIATISSDGSRGVSTVGIPTAEGPARLATILSHTRGLARELSLAEVEEPGVIVVEQPSGRTPNPQLVYAVGVVIAALVEACAPTVVETVASSRWKAVACGKGNIYKPRSKADGEYGVLTWARTVGYTGDSFDECDAYGVAEYARRTFALEER
jgi:hypothetical protein